MHASHVVVDRHDGYTFWKGADGALFDAGTAAAFAAARNAEMKPEHRLYQVYALTPAGCPCQDGHPGHSDECQAPALHAAPLHAAGDPELGELPEPDYSCHCGSGRCARHGTA